MDESIINKELIPEVLNSQDLTISRQNVKSDGISYFDKDKLIYLLKQIPPGMHNILFQFLWRTGCRVTEAVSLLKKDIDFENNIICIRWLKSRKYNYRNIPLHSSLRNVLYMYVDRLRHDEKLFPISRQRVYQLCQKYNLDHPHKIRHSFAVNFLRQSDRPMALIELKELLGHANIKTTMEYLKIVPQNQAKALEGISFD